MHASDVFPVYMMLAALLWLLAALGGGVLFASTGRVVFGVVFLDEELDETGVVLFLPLRLSLAPEMPYNPER